MRLFHKLFLTVLACVAAALLTLVLVSRVSLESGMQRLIQFQDERQAGMLVYRLQQYYEGAGTWDALRQQPRLWSQLLRARWSGGPREPALRPPGMAEERRGFSLYRRAYLLDAQRDFVAGTAKVQAQTDTLMAISLDDEVVGWLGFSPASRPVRLPEERALASSLQRALTIAALVTLVLAAVAAWLMARGIARPVAAIGDTVKSLADGNFETRGDLSGSREIRRLARDVNGLAAALDRNQRLRHEWMTEIAHELRTPVTVLRGEIEAIRDGIRHADQRSMASLHEEVAHLSTLLDDLQELALSDAGALSYRMAPLDLSALVRALVDEYSPQFEVAGLTVTMDPCDSIMVNGDSGRLRQLLHNLLRNSLRHTDAGGCVSIALTDCDQQASLRVADSAPGVEPAALDRLFERFFRVSADRRKDGSGLGLTICQRIVQAHGGRIQAMPSDLGGLEIAVTLPMLESPRND